MATRRHKHLALIIARELASQLSTATLIADADGNLVFYNEAAEELLGRAFADVGELSASEWSGVFSVTDLDGAPIPLEEIPGGVALLERRPAHRDLRFTALDGIPREVSVTGLPLLSHADELVGSVSLFWQPGSDERPG